MLEPSLTGWQAQYDRMMRGYTRVKKPYQSSVDYDDDLQHFFQDCFHLRDWIKKDANLSVGDAVEQLFQHHKSLQVAADLANASKHFVRRTHREGAYVTSTSVTVHLGQAKPVEVITVITLADGSTTTAQDLIDEVIAAWNDVLAQLSLK